jgi:hypothetical protein
LVFDRAGIVARTTCLRKHAVAEGLSVRQLRGRIVRQQVSETVAHSGEPKCRQPVIAGATPEERDPANWPAPALAAIQRVLDRSRARAGPAVRETFEHSERRMSAAEFVRFWNGVRMKAMATASADGTPHIAPVHAEFVNGRLRSTIYENAVRRIDLQGNPRVALTTWGADGSVAIVYGRAREVPDSGRDTRPGATGKPRRTVALDIEVTRIYAMKARSERVSE